MPDPADVVPAHGAGPRSAAARQRTIGGLGGAAPSALLITWAVLREGALVTGVDESIAGGTREWADRLAWPIDLAHAIGRATWYAVAAAIVVVGVILVRHRAAAVLLALSGLLGVALTELGKVSMGRVRPPGAEQFQPDLARSFPSGHASVGIYLFLALGVVLVRLGRVRGSRPMSAAGWGLVVLGPCVGLTRLVLGVHWPSDVLGGWAFGAVALLASAVLLWWPVDKGWGSQGRSGTPISDQGP